MSEHSDKSANSFQQKKINKIKSLSHSSFFSPPVLFFLLFEVKESSLAAAGEAQTLSAQVEIHGARLTSGECVCPLSHASASHSGYASVPRPIAFPLQFRLTQKVTCCNFFLFSPLESFCLKNESFPKKDKTGSWRTGKKKTKNVSAPLRLPVNRRAASFKGAGPLGRFLPGWAGGKAPPRRSSP